MRTKTMILSATCGLLGALAAQADSVYSVNVVGYANVSYKAKQNTLFSNPLSGSNTLTSVFASLTDADSGLVLYIWDTSKLQYQYAIYGGPSNDGWYDDYGNSINSYPLATGQGGWIVPSEDVTITYVGNVLTGNLSNPLVAGWTQIGSQVPQNAGASTLGLTAVAGAGDAIYKWLGDGWAIYYFDPDQVAWYNINSNAYEDPQLGIGEGIWYANANASTSWTRTFTIN